MPFGDQNWLTAESYTRNDQRPFGDLLSIVPDPSVKDRVYASVVFGGEASGIYRSNDGGETWADADLGPDEGRWAWRGWGHLWRPKRTGYHELCCRGRDVAGNVQPLEPQWNVGGYSNNAVQRVPVTVTE